MSSKHAGPQRDAKAGTWWFVVDQPRGPNGERRQARRRGFPTKKAAQEALDKIRVGSREGTFVAPDRMTVREYLDGWVAGLEVSGRKPSTVASYKRNLRVHVIPALGGTRLQHLSPLQLDALYADLRTSGNKVIQGGLSARSVRYIHTIVRRALADALRKGLTARNVADAASPPSAKSAKAPEMAFWTPDELRTFLASVEGEYQLGALFRLTAMTGLRRGEVCGLRWSDVDLEEGRVTVRQQLVMIAGGEGRVVRVQNYPKSDAGRRSIDLDLTTLAVLRAHRKQQAEHRLLSGEAYNTEADLVFGEFDGSPFTDPEHVSNAFTVRARRAGLKRIRFHDLRHTHCAHLIAADVNIKAISRRLGHASVSFTLDRYGHLLPEADSDAAAAVAALVDGLAS